MQYVRTHITPCVITLHRRLEKTERKSVGKRQEKEKKQGTRKEREKTGTGWKDKGMAVRTAERKKRKNCNYAIRLSLTAKSVAEEMGISRQQLCNIEQSETAPVVVKYIAFLRSKGVDLNALFDRIIVNK